MTTSPTLASRWPPQQRQVGGRRDDDPLARQMRRQRATCRPLPHMGCDDRPGGSLGGRLVLGRGLLELGQLELELVDEPLAALAGLAELLAPGFGQEQLQAFDLEAGSRDQSLGLLSGIALGQDHGVRRGEVVWQGCRLVAHEPMQAHPILFLKIKRQTKTRFLRHYPAQLGSPGPSWHSPVDTFEKIAELTGRDRHHTIGR